MKTKSFWNVSYIGLIVIILVFLFIYFSYFFIYIPRNEAKLEQKAFRILKEYGKNMIDKNQYYENYFKNYGLFYPIKFLKNSKEIIKKEKIDEEHLVLFKDMDNVIEDLFSFVKTNKLPDDTTEIISEIDDTFYLNYKNGEIEQSKIDTVKWFFQTSPENLIDSLLKQPFVNRIPVSNFMENLKFDELFEKITVFYDTTGFYNSGSEKIFDITNPEALKDTLGKSQGGIHKIMNIRGQKTHLMILPIKFRGEDFFIAGSISDTFFRQKTRNINTQLIIYIASLLLLVIIGMPVLKIIFIDPRERLKAFDATASGISFMAGLGLITIITISLLKTQVADPFVNLNRIDSVSTVLLKNVKTDIDSIKKLGYLIGKESRIHDSARHNKTKNIDTTILSNRVIIHFFDTIKFKKVDHDIIKLPFQLNEIILIDPSGIVQKAYSRTPFSELVEFNLSDREYFKNAVNINNTWPDSNLNFYIQSIKSYNTGYFETAISFHTDLFDTLPVLAITSKIPSLYNQVLPMDMDFLIINNKGNVLYHSKTDKNLHENFIQECDSDPELLHAIDVKAKKNITVNYDEKQWLARIQPVDDTPLFHVTLLDLSQGRNINASIFLFTFFFSLVSFIFLSIAFLVLSIFTLSKDNADKHVWILQWIVLKPNKYNTYITLIVILTIFAIMQIFGYWITDSPEQNFIYQLILSFSVILISILMLNDNWSNIREFFKKPVKYLPVSVLILTLFTLIFYLLLQQKLIFIELIIAVAPLFVFILYFILSYKLIPGLKPKELSEERLNELKKTNYIGNIYLTFLMLWLVNISVIPVAQYYLSFKKQETEHRIDNIQLNVALKNIDLISDFPDYNSVFKSDWFHRIRGNEIDSMNVTHIPLCEQHFIDAKKKNSEKNNDSTENTELHDLVFSILNYRDSVSTRNYSNYWFSKDTIYFKQGATTGAITVSYSAKNPTINSFWYILTVILIAGIVIIMIWYLLRYISNVILNLKQEEPFIPNLSWPDLIKAKKHKKIILKSFDGDIYLSDTKKIRKIIKKLNVNNLKAKQIISPEFDLKKILKDSSDIIWINEFKPVLYTPDSHDKLISNIQALSENSDKIVVLDIPFDIEFITEFLDEYVDSGDSKPEELKNIFLLKKKWVALFNEYLRYYGYSQQHNSGETKPLKCENEYQILENQKEKMRNKEIWSNLTMYEKIVLHDLAEDGLLNRKDNLMIENLIKKRLIIADPNPEIFSNKFREFILYEMKSSDIKLIESKLGLKGRWHNARYLILLIIIPLAAFILISQGLSLEKIFGIFAAGIAAVTGLMRLFESSIFNQG